MCIVISTRLDNPVECRSPHVSLPADTRSNCVLRWFMGPSVGRLLPLTCAVNVGGKEAAWHCPGGGEACSGSIFATLPYHVPRPIAVYNAFHFFHAPLRLPAHSISFTALSSPFLTIHRPLLIDCPHGRPIHAC